jgi:hypothetical protein
VEKEEHLIFAFVYIESMTVPLMFILQSSREFCIKIKAENATNPQQ